MLSYIIVLILIALAAFINPTLVKLRNYGAIKVLYWIIVVILILLAGLRYDVGKDYLSYSELYKLSANLYQMKEIGFIGITEFLNYFDVPFFIFCLIFAGLSVVLTCNYVYRHSPYVFLSILIYFALGNFYFSVFNVMRQALATSIFLYSFKYIENQRLLSYILIIALTAIFVHASSIILLPLYFILNRNYGFIRQCFIIGCIITIGSFAMLLVSKTPYAIYLDFEFLTDPPMTYLLLGIISLICLIYGAFNSEWRKEYRILYNINSITLGLIILMFINAGTPLIMIINRILGFFTIVLIILSPALIKEIKSHTIRAVSYIFLIFLLSSLSYLSLKMNGDTNNMVPYKTILNL